MRNLMKLAVLFSCALPLGLLAAEDHSQHQAQAGAGKAADHMKEMESQMNAIMNEKDPAKKHELMEKHMSAMHEHMQAMKKDEASKEQGMASRMKSMEERMEKMESEMRGMMGKPGTEQKRDEKPAEHKH